MVLCQRTVGACDTGLTTFVDVYSGAGVKKVGEAIFDRLLFSPYRRATKQKWRQIYCRHFLYCLGLFNSFCVQPGFGVDGNHVALVDELRYKDCCSRLNRYFLESVTAGVPLNRF